MEAQLAHHLLTIAARYGEIRGKEESTIGRLCAFDARFFSRIREGKTFTVKKYDEVMGWFAANWPPVPWPDDVPRPEPRQTAEPPPAAEPAAA